MRPLPLLVPLVVLLAAGSARADRFVYRYRPGQVVQYRSSMAGASMMGQTGGQMMKANFRAGMRQTQRVRSVSGGVVTLQITDTPTGGSATSMGRTEAYPQSPSTSVVRMTARGKFLSRKAKGEAETASPMDGLDALYGLNFPDRDLKPGETWEDSFTIGAGEAAQKVQVRSRYGGMVTFRGRTCAKFTSTLLTSTTSGGEAAGSLLPTGQGKLTGVVTTYFDPAAGLEVYSSGSVSMIARADLSQVSQDAGEFAGVTKINIVQSLLAGGRTK